MIDRSNFDWSQFDVYRHMNVHNNECDASFQSSQKMLHVWEDAKNEYLHRLFPKDQLIMERSFSYEKDEEEMRREFCDLSEEFRDFYIRFRDALLKALDPESMYSSYYYRHETDERSMRYQCIDMMYQWFQFDRLWENSVEFPWVWQMRHINRYEVDIMGHKLMLQPGMKLMKTWGKICNWLGLSNEFEEFRLRQSQLTNTKRITGTMCLSIHPLDFATASDNENGWSSCMSWRESGCYRMGTVEMMNSPIVLCAYVKSDKAQMTINEKPWNSKKWRAWVLITPEAILMNRQYPYHSDNIGKAICGWVRDLVAEKIGWTYHADFYTDLLEAFDTAEHAGLVPDRIHWVTNFMYNDISNDDLGYIGVRDNWKDRAEGFRDVINFSGQAQCMWCGALIDFHNNSEDADSLGCLSHEDQCWTCEDCGHEITDEDEVWYGPSGEVWCSECYHEHVKECEDCGNPEYVEDTHTIYLPFSNTVDKKWFEQIKNSNDHSHPLHGLLVTHRFSWNNELDTPILRTHNTASICLCRNCFGRMQNRWRNNPATGINLLQANPVHQSDFVQNGYEWAYDWHKHNNHETTPWVIDSRKTDMDIALDFINPYKWSTTKEDSFDGHYLKQEVRDETRKYFAEQYAVLTNALEKAAADMTSPKEIYYI